MITIKSFDIIQKIFYKCLMKAIRTFPIFKEIGKFIGSALLLFLCSYITNIFCSAPLHQSCHSLSDGSLHCEVVIYLRDTDQNICDQPLSVFLIIFLLFMFFLLWLNKKKKISKSWIVYFLIWSLLFFINTWIIDKGLSQ